VNKHIPDELYQKIVEHIPIVSSDVVVIDENKVLLLRRIIEPLKDYWALPGGRLLLGETPRIAACRKLKEETGMYVAVWELVGERVVTYFHPGRQNIAITYLAYYNGDDVILNADHNSYLWTTRDELPSPMWDTTVEQVNWALQKGMQLTQILQKGGT